MLRKIAFGNVIITNYSPTFRIVDGTLQRSRKIDVEERTIDTADNSDLWSPLLGDGGMIAAAVASSTFNIMGGLGRTTLFVPVLLPLSSVGGGVETTNVSDTVDWLPALEVAWCLIDRWISKTGGGECSLCPAVVDGSKVPLD
jgi:hypothetical protein